MELSSCAMSFLLNLLSRWFDALIAIPFIKGVLNLVSRWFNAFIAIPFVKGFWWRSVGFYLWVAVQSRRHHRYLLSLVVFIDILIILFSSQPAPFATLLYAAFIVKKITIFDFIERRSYIKEAIDRNLSTEFLRSLGLKNSPFSLLFESIFNREKLSSAAGAATILVGVTGALNLEKGVNVKRQAKIIEDIALDTTLNDLAARGSTSITGSQVAALLENNRSEAKGQFSPSIVERFFGDERIPSNRKLTTHAASFDYPKVDPGDKLLPASKFVESLQALIKSREAKELGNIEVTVDISNTSAASVAEPHASWPNVAGSSGISDTETDVVAASIAESHASWLDILGLPSEAVLGSFPLGLELYVVIMCALLSLSVSWTRSPFMALMYAVMLFMNASFAMFLLGFEFLALVNMLVYVGALAVLFLFVIMLLEMPATELRAYGRGWSTLALAGLAASRFVPGTHGGPTWIASQGFTLNGMSFTPTFEALNFVGHALYISYADLLMLNSLVLTAALLGALVSAHVR